MSDRGGWKRQEIIKLYFLRFYLLFLVPVMVLAGCVGTPNLPPTDTIIAIKPTDSGIIASSSRYSYRFFRKGMPQEYERYKTFYGEFHLLVSGIRVSFAVKGQEVKAEYLVLIDSRKINAGQRSMLMSKYGAVPVDQNYLGVFFRATGFWSSAHAPELAEPYRLERPVVVSIRDHTKTLSLVGEAVLVPLAPLFMMYGCFAGRCI